MKNTIRIITISREIYDWGKILTALDPKTEFDKINKVLDKIHELHEESRKLTVAKIVIKDQEKIDEN